MHYWESYIYYEFISFKWKTTLFCFLSFDQFEEEEENTNLVNLIQYCSLFVDVLPLGVVLGMLYKLLMTLILVV